LAISILARLREYVGDRRHTPRRGARFPTSVPVSVTPLDKGAEPSAARGASVAGVTRDLAAAGLTLSLGAVRAGGRYLTDTDCHLGVRLELPAGDVFLLARVARFEQPSEPGGGYLLGLRILGARGADRTAYYEFLKSLAPAERRSGERARSRAELSRGGYGVPEWPVEAETITASELRAAFEGFIGMEAPGRRT